MHCLSVTWYEWLIRQRSHEAQHDAARVSSRGGNHAYFSQRWRCGSCQPRRVFIWANRPQRRATRFAAVEANWVAWSIGCMSAKRWINASCLSSALAVHAMLRRRGIVSRLCLGVARDASAVVAHAWVEAGQHVIVGAAEAGRFTQIVQFGGAVKR